MRKVEAGPFNRDILMKSVWSTMGLMVVLVFSAWTSESPPASNLLLQYCSDFRQIQMDVRDCAITPDSAARAFKQNIDNIRKVFGEDSCNNGAGYVYPVKGYRPKESIGGRGRGYRPDGFDLFDMDVQGSHPAHDLFIRDKNKDGLDDYTQQPADILAFSSGMVLACEKNWTVDSDRRGGNWIWIYDPCLNGVFYYAHNRKVVVDPGQWVEAGEKIAEMGRSGFNANKHRSPTHLHFMYLQIDAYGQPQPGNTYDWLLEARPVD
ncbi:peptidase M23-like protein [Dyadobacter jejuensis]|uniref:Peptidase M23-like protein n=1 Tax=Dyadobacter jejuensis TaxID=1082580 RepID=A0A316ASL3_9BACT|nr:M23 family metallopeptidase [Dyadobacter jejuensis]PWJ60441.1 peptidase M23-like protein [Dyadobacter jejuensis]